MRVESGGVGQDPNLGPADGFGLETELGFFAVEGDAVGSDADDGDETRLIAEDFAGEDFSAFAKLVGAELVGHGGGAGTHVGDAKVPFQEAMGVERGDEGRREAAFVHGRPEAVAGPCEMVADGGGVQAGVDADEEDVEIGSDDVGDGFGVGLQ